MTAALADARLFPAVAAINAELGNEAVSAAATLDLTVRTSNLTISGSIAYTLPDPTGTAQNYAGLRHRVVCVAASNTPIGTLTVTSPETTTGLACASSFKFTDVGQAIDFVWTGTKWRAERVQRSGNLAVTPGTTVLTGYSLCINYICSVDGTAAGTGTGGLPNGSAPGERCIITCSLANNTPVGSLTGSYKNLLGAAATICGAIGVVASASVVGDIAVLEWDGGAWQAIYQAGVTFS